MKPNQANILWESTGYNRNGYKCYMNGILNKEGLVSEIYTSYHKPYDPSDGGMMGFNYYLPPSSSGYPFAEKGEPIPFALAKEKARGYAAKDGLDEECCFTLKEHREEKEKRDVIDASRTVLRTRISSNYYIPDSQKKGHTYLLEFVAKKLGVSYDSLLEKKGELKVVWLSKCAELNGCSIPLVVKNRYAPSFTSLDGEGSNCIYVERKTEALFSFSWYQDYGSVFYLEKDSGESQTEFVPAYRWALCPKELSVEDFSEEKALYVSKEIKEKTHA